MALAFIVDGGLNDPPGNGTELFEAFPAVGAAYTQAAEWTGVPVKRLLSWELARTAEYQQVGAIRQAALVLGVCDVLAERGVRPGVVAGMSRGSMVGAAVAGAVDRRDLFELLGQLREAPAAAGAAQGVAQLLVPPGIGLQEFTGGFPEGVYVAGEIGLVADGAAHLLLLSGYRESLQQLADQLRDKTAIRIPPDVTTAFHSPLRNHVREFQEPRIAAIAFRDPEVPLCGGLEPGMYATAGQVREMFRRNHTEPISLPRLLAALDRNRTKLGLLIGPGLVGIWRSAARYPVVHIEHSIDISEAVDAIHESGMLPTAP